MIFWLLYVIFPKILILFWKCCQQLLIFYIHHIDFADWPMFFNFLGSSRANSILNLNDLFSGNEDNNKLMNYEDEMPSLGSNNPKMSSNVITPR